MSGLPTFLEQLDPEVYLTNNYLVLDFETDTSAGPQFYGHSRHPENQLLLACWKTGPASRDIEYHNVWAQWGNDLEQEWLLCAIERADFLVAHNAKYELGWLKRCGLDLHKVLVFDTKLAEYVLLGNLAAGSKDLGMAPRSTSLDMCCRRRGIRPKDPVVDTLIKNGVNPRDIPRPWLQGRCQDDVLSTEQVFLSQRTELQRRGLLPVQFTRCLLTPVLADIEQEGLCVDEADVSAEYSKQVIKVNELQAEMEKLVGVINTRSPIQMAKVLYEDLGFKELTNKRGEPIRNEPTKTFPAGVPCIDLDTIEKLVAKTEKQRKFVELHKELNKAKSMLSKNVEFFQGVVEEYGGKFFGEISQTSTATHRTSSQGVPLTFQTITDPDTGKPVTRRVQFQNFVRTLKKLFKAKREGWLIADPDGSQIEFRCAAFLGNDSQAIADIDNVEFDAHLQTASILHGCTIEEVRAEKKRSEAAGKDDWRQLAKPDTYKPLYGGRKGTPEQERYYEWFRQHYCGIANAQDSWVEEAVDTKSQRTPWGLTYYWPTARRSAFGRVNAETAICNYPIQALATAEIVPIAAVYLWHRLAVPGLSEEAVLVNMVHDSIPCEVHPDAVEEFTAIVKQAFTADVYHYLDKVYGLRMDRVPLGVGLKIGERWGQGKEHAWDIYRDGREIKRK